MTGLAMKVFQQGCSSTATLAHPRRRNPPPVFRPIPDCQIVSAVLPGPAGGLAYTAATSP